jgi:hypothetical protein
MPNNTYPGPHTNTFTTDDVGNPEAVSVASRCRRVRIWPQDGSSDYWFKGVNSGSVRVKKFAGEPTVIDRPAPGQYAMASAHYGDPGFYEVGDIVAYVEAVTGTITMAKEEYL